MAKQTKKQAYVVRPRISINDLEHVMNELDAEGYDVILEDGLKDANGDCLFTVIGQKG